jgi:hypothetical protein
LKEYKIFKKRSRVKIIITMNYPNKIGRVNREIEELSKDKERLQTA